MTDTSSTPNRIDAIRIQQVDPRSETVTGPNCPDTASLDFTQRLERKFAKYNASQNVLRRWLFEIICWVTSALCMGAIILICIYSKDQPLSKWPLALTITNVLAKVASAALILPISEAIGQLKWTWFSGPTSKEMIDFEIFDKASRGAWGSFLLIFRTRGRSLAALGALLTLLMLATDSFFQQMTDLPERWVLQGHGEVPRVVEYDGDNGYIYEDGTPMGSAYDANLQQVTSKFFYSNNSDPLLSINGTRSELLFQCPSSRCEWESYDSLGICSACEDISDLLTFACLTTKLDWISSVRYNETTHPTGTACGYWLNSTSSNPKLMSGYQIQNASDRSTRGEVLLLRTLPLNSWMSSRVPFSSAPYYGGSHRFKDVYFPLLDAFIVSAPDNLVSNVYDHVPPVAQECMISWCVKTIKSSYAWGKYTELITHSTFNLTADTQPYPWEAFENSVDGEEGVFTIFHGNISIQAATQNSSTTTYGVSNNTYTQAAILFEDVFPSFITVANESARPWWRVKTFAWGKNRLREVDFCPWQAPNNVTKHLERLTTSMTSAIRSKSGHLIVTGNAYTLTTYIAVHWAWVSFPLALLVLCLVFLIATIQQTSKGNGTGLGIWKISTMPTLIYGLPQDLQGGVLNQTAWGRKGNERVRIRLLPSHGWRVSRQMCISPTAATSRTGRSVSQRT